MTQAQDDTFIAALKSYIATSTRPAETRYDAFRAAAQTWLATKVAVPPPPVPVLTPANFTLPAGYGIDALVGHIEATNAPTSFAIVSGDPNNYFDVWPTSNNLRTSEAGPIPPAGTYTLGITGTNTAGTGPVATFTVAAQGAVVDPPPATSDVTHGQQITTAKVGRAGAAALSGFGALTDQGATTFTTTQTIRNKRFTGRVNVTGGVVTFEFCSFVYAPPSASTGIGAALYVYNGGAETGSVICNHCDFDSGLRGAQGNFETCGVQLGQRGGANPATINRSSAFTINRCRVEGFGNGIGIHKWQNAPSVIRECYISSLTSGGGSHCDGIEVYSSDNVIIERNRIVITANHNSCVNVAPMDIVFPSPGDPIVIRDNYINGGVEPLLTRWADQGVAASSIEKVKYTGNYLGDVSGFDAECDFHKMDVTFDSAWAASNPKVIFWDKTNVWAPNGEGVSSHTKGAFVDESNFFAGEFGAWDGHVVGPTTSPPTVPPPTTVPPPLPPAPGFPDATNTGVPLSVSLTPSGGLNITTQGAVIEGRAISGTLTVSANNVTIRKCKISASGWAVISIATGVTGTTIEDCDINGMNAEGVRGISGQGTFLRNNIHDVEDGVYVQGPSLIRDNFIHDLKSNWSGPHYDGVAIDGGADVTISHNTIINTNSQTSAVMIDNYFGPISNITVDNNLLVGGAYTIFVDGQFSGGSVTGVKITNNRLSKGQFGYIANTKTSPVFTGNVDNATGQPV